MISNFWPIWIMFFYVFIKVNNFLCCFIILLHLFSSFLLTRSLLVLYAYVFISSSDSILLLSFELKAILLVSSVKTLCLSVLNLCCVFDIDLLFLMNSLWFFTILCPFYFFLDGLLYSQIELLLNCFYNFQI